MTGIFSLISLIACQQGFDKDGSEINETNEYGETVDEDGNSLSTSNHDWDEDGYTEDQGDCDDDNPDINPGEEEVYYDDIDSNCDGLNDFDADADGHISANWGGDDCDDSNPLINHVEDDPTDGIDTDYDGQDDPFISYVLDENASESNGSIALDVDRDKRGTLSLKTLAIYGTRVNHLHWDPGDPLYQLTCSLMVTSLSEERGNNSTGNRRQFSFHIAYSETDGWQSVHQVCLFEKCQSNGSEWSIMKSKG